MSHSAADHDGSAAVRIDVWLWAVRLVKTRGDAAAACRGGHVRINDKVVKPAAQVVPGDAVRLWANHREAVVTVEKTLLKRVGAPIAKTCYVDNSPERPSWEVMGAVPMRPRGSGRPTKKERRQLDRLRGRSSY